jgi:hypothetical protein
MTSEVKDIGGYPFKRVCNIQPIEDSNGVVLSFFPQSRYKMQRIFHCTNTVRGCSVSSK